MEILLDICANLHGGHTMENPNYQNISDSIKGWLDSNGQKLYTIADESFLAVLENDLTMAVYNLKTNERSSELTATHSTPSACFFDVELAHHDFEGLKKAVYELIRQTTANLQDFFQTEKVYSASDWKDLIDEEPVFKILFRHFVWIQGGRTFTLSLTEEKLIDCKGRKYNLRKTYPVGLALVDEMENEGTLEAWKDYFVKNNLKQPFEQIR